jgi:hypothetical protein
MLIVTNSSGHVLDDIELVNDALVYNTGVSRGFVEGRRVLKPQITDEQLYALVADTSNGYVSIKTSDGGAQ